MKEIFEIFDVWIECFLARLKYSLHEAMERRNIKNSIKNRIGIDTHLVKTKPLTFLGFISIFPLKYANTFHLYCSEESLI